MTEYRIVKNGLDTFFIQEKGFFWGWNYTLVYDSYYDGDGYRKHFSSKEDAEKFLQEYKETKKQTQIKNDLRNTIEVV